MISINLYEIFFQMLNFGVLLFFVNKLLIKPVHKVLTERAEKIQGQIQDSQDMKKEAEQLLGQQKQALQEARVEAKEIRERSELSAEEEKQRLVDQAKQEAQRLLVQAKKDIDSQVIAAKKSLLDEIGNSAISLSSQLLKRNLDAKDQKAIISQGVQS